MENKNNNVGKFIIVKDLLFSDFMKDDEGNINIYDTFSDAALVCGMYEFEDVYVMKIDARYTEKDSDKSGMMYRIKESRFHCNGLAKTGFKCDNQCKECYKLDSP